MRLAITADGGVKTCEPESNSVYSKIRPQDQSDLDTKGRRWERHPAEDVLYMCCADSYEKVYGNQVAQRQKKQNNDIQGIKRARSR